ncbi:MAG: Methionine aminopeptidase, partial [uncultured Thermomicrobiales bacterium]
GDYDQEPARNRTDARGEPGRRARPRPPRGGDRAGRDAAGSERAGARDHPRRRRQVVLPRPPWVSRGDLRVRQRRDRAWHSQPQAAAGRRLDLRRRRRDRRRLPRRFGLDLPGWERLGRGPATAGGHRGGALRRDRRGESGQPAKCDRERDRGVRGPARLRHRPRLRRARDRPLDVGGAPRRQPRRFGPRTGSAAGDDPGDRADAELGYRRDAGVGRPVDGSHQGRAVVGPFRAHGGDHRRRGAGHLDETAGGGGTM